jgi:hypothetical protein
MFRLRLSVQSPGTIQCSRGLSMAPNGRWLLLRPPLAACSQVCTVGRRPRFNARITSSQITSTTTAVIRRSILVTLSRPLIDELDNDQARPVVIGYPLLLITLDALLDRYQRRRLAEKDQQPPTPAENGNDCAFQPVPPGPWANRPKGDLNSLVASRCYGSPCMLPFMDTTTLIIIIVVIILILGGGGYWYRGRR